MRRVFLAVLAASLAFAAPANARPTVRFTWSPNSPVTGQAVTFDGSATRCDRRPCSYTWQDDGSDGPGGNNTPLGTGAVVTYTFTTSGTKWVRLTVRNRRGQSASVMHTVTVGAASQPPPPPPTTGSNCMPTPSACGFPDATNAGTLRGVARDAVSGTVTLSTAGQVYENKTVTGGIVVTAPDVTIRNVKVISRNYQAIRARKQEGNTSGLLIQDVEIDLQGNEDAYGIIEDGYTAVRTYIHNGADCAHLGTNATIRDSFCSLGPDSNNDGWADSTSFCSGPEHFDGYSSDGGSNQVYDHNTIRNPCSQTSAILISTNTSPISDVTITDNLMAGGGWTLYCAATSSGVGGTEIVTGNRFAKAYWPKAGWYGPAAYCSGTGVDSWSGNVWDDTGLPIS